MEEPEAVGFWGMISSCSCAGNTSSLTNNTEKPNAPATIKSEKSVKKSS
jgi:hypothetical protein